MAKVTWIVANVFILLSLAAAASTCRKYQCKNPVDPVNPELCALQDKKGTADWVEYVGDCPEGRWCPMSKISEDASRCEADPFIEKHPGMKCKYVEHCTGKKVIDGICRGKGKDEPCTNHDECDVRLMCGAEQKCIEAMEEGVSCDSNHYLCQSYLTCKEGTCVRYGALKIGDHAGVNGEDLCETHHVDKNGMCSIAPLLKGPIFVDTLDVPCQYDNGEETQPQCGYHADGKAICTPGAGDLAGEWKNLLKYLNDKPECSPYTGMLGQCDYAIKMGKEEYLKGRIAYYKTHQYANIQNVPGCVQKWVDSTYYELVGFSASLSLLFPLLIALAFLLL